MYRRLIHIEALDIHQVDTVERKTLGKSVLEFLEQLFIRQILRELFFGVGKEL